MNTFKYKYILAIAEEQSLSKAAVRLFLSQPYLSKILNEVETEYNIKIFDRSRKPLLITPEGERFIKYINDLLLLRSELNDDLETLKSQSMHMLRFGISPNRGSYIIPRVLSEFGQRYPHINVTLLEDHYSNILTSIINNEIDMGVISLSNFPESLTYETIINEKILLALPPSHRMGTPDALGSYRAPPPFPMDQLCRLRNSTCVITPLEFRFGKYLQKYLKGTQLLETCKLVFSNSMTTIFQLMLRGVGFAFLPESCIRLHPLRDKAFYYTLGEPALEWVQVVAYRRDLPLNKEMRYFIQLVQKAYKEELL